MNKNYKQMLSIKKIYKIGRGPSSSHTIGPEKACKRFKKEYNNANLYKVILFGSLTKTGIGHRTDEVIKKTFFPTNTEVICNYDVQTEHPNTLDIYAYKDNIKIGKVRGFIYAFLETAENFV